MEHPNEQQTTGVALRPIICLLGLGLLFAQDWCSQLMSPATPANTQLTPGAFASLLGVAVYLACAYAPQAARKVASTRILFWVLPLVLLAGQLLGVYTPNILAANTGRALYSAAAAFLTLFWLVECCQEEPRTFAIVLPCAYLLAAIMYFVLSPLPQAITTPLICLFPFASGLLFAAYQLRGMSARTTASSLQSNSAIGWTFPLYPVVLMAIFKFVFYFSLSLTTGPSMFGQLGILLICTFTAAFAALFYDRFRPAVLYKLALPLMVAGLLMVSWVNLGTPAATLVENAGNIAFELFLLITLAEGCFRYRIEPYWMFGIVQAVASLAGSLGFNAGLAFTSNYPAGTTESNLFIMVVIVALIALSTFFFNERKSTRGYSAENAPALAENQKNEIPTGEGTVNATMTYHEELVWRCDLLAAKHGLSIREKEILVLLAQGMSGARIEDELVISRNTVKTHTRHIYEKLGVHSRDEARALVEGVR